jgi:hypothetical protein
VPVVILWAFTQIQNFQEANFNIKSFTNGLLLGDGIGDGNLKHCRFSAHRCQLALTRKCILYTTHNSSHPF